MAKLYIHIGSHKTGTSYLQALFNGNRHRLASAGLLYPKTYPLVAHHALAARWMHVHVLTEEYWKTHTPDGVWSHLIDTYAKAPGSVFISSECFSRFEPEAMDFKDLAKAVAPFDEVEIIYTVRNQADLVPSLWSQMARSSKAQELKRFVRQATQQGICGGVAVDHLLMYETIRTGFSANQIHIFDYNSFASIPGGIAGAFLAHMGADLTASQLRRPSRADANFSPNPLALYMAARLHTDGPPPKPLVAMITRQIQRLGLSNTTLLTCLEWRKLRRRHKESNRELVRLVRMRQPDFTFDEGKPQDQIFFRDDVSADLWRRIAKELYGGSYKDNHARNLSRKIMDKIATG